MGEKVFETLKCKLCGTEDYLEFLCEEVVFRKASPRSPSKRKVHMDKHGFFWRLGFCHLCQNKKSRERKGLPSVADSLGPNLVKGNKSEVIAQQYFERIGFEVKRGHGRGPDLFIKLGIFDYTVEVKSTSKPGNGFKVPKVTERCKSCDFVVYVYPDGKLYIEDMQIHLKHLYKSGERNVTKFYKFAHN